MLAFQSLRDAGLLLLLPGFLIGLHALEKNSRRILVAHLLELLQRNDHARVNRLLVPGVGTAHLLHVRSLHGLRLGLRLLLLVLLVLLIL